MLRGSARALLSKVHCMPGRLRLALYRPQALLPQEYALQVKPCSWNHHRQFAEAAVAPKFDWDSLESSISSDEGKRDLASLRSTWIDVQQKFSSMSESSGEIDWKSYEKEIDPQVLKMFRDSFSSLDFPLYDTTALAKEAESKLDGIIKQADELKAHSEKRMKELEKEIADCERAKDAVAHSTIDDELAADPATAKQIDQEISEGNFIP